MAAGSWRSKFNLAVVEDLLKTVQTSDSFISIMERTNLTPVWYPTENPHVEDDPARTEHIRELNLPQLPAAPEPPMMLQALGYFAREPKLKRRMDSVFGGRNTFLLNTSGTGKTRLLFEGLCRHWGFYFTSAVDTTRLGVYDLQDALQHGGDLDKDEEFTRPFIDKVPTAEQLERNSSIAHRYFSSILLSRLLVFKLFLTVAVAHGYVEEYKMIWLKVQLLLWPDLLIHFEGIARALFRSLPKREDFDIAVSETMEEISTIEDITRDGPVFIVLDEANSAAHKLEDCFVDRDGHHISALKCILNTWKHHLDNPRYAFVVAGTEIPRQHFMGDEWSNWVWSSDTGAFDDKEEQSRYAMQFLPPIFASSPPGKLLLDRMWKWTRGRHRCTAAFLSVLLEEQFYLPNVQLNHYILKLSDDYWPKDLLDEDYEKLARVHMPFAPISFKILDSNRRMASCVHETMLSFLLQTGERVYFFGDDVALVNNSIARFVDTDCDLITIDEPFIVAGAASWFTNPKHFLLDLDYFTEKILEPTISPQHSLGYVALCIAATYDSEEDRPLDEVFELPEETKELLKGVGGRIITRRTLGKEASDTVFRYSVDPSVQMVRWSRSIEDTISWIKNPSVPFCVHLPANNEIGTLMFIIKTSDGERFWVFLRVLPPADDDEFATKTITMVDSCHPNNIFQHEVSSAELAEALTSLPDLSPHVGRSGVLRVFVSFTQGLRLPSKLDSDDESIAATLQMKTVSSSTRSYTSDDTIMEVIADAIVESAVSLDRPPKRKREVSTPTGPRETDEAEIDRDVKRPLVDSSDGTTDEGSRKREDKGKGKEKETTVGEKKRIVGKRKTASASGRTAATRRKTATVTQKKQEETKKGKAVVKKKTVSVESASKTVVASTEHEDAPQVLRRSSRLASKHS